ncbi:glyoxylate reductase [Globomyces pollinis-pini]|nr:glyoxylate reductase [Globomyces pollinis-pini]
MNTKNLKRILVTRKLPIITQQKLEKLNVELTQWQSHEQAIPRHILMDWIKEKDGVLLMLTDKVDTELLSSGSKLQCLSTMSVGCDHIDLEACKNRKVEVYNTPGVLTDATAELAIGLLLSTLRKIPQAINAVKDGKWGPWNPVWMCGTQLTGKTVGIVGLGSIGMAIAERLIPFKIKSLLYTGRTKKETIFPSMFCSLDDLVAQSDIVIIACDLNAQTKGMFDKSVFEKMKSNSVLINIARGLIVNQSDLVDALDNHQIEAVGLDTTDPEPLDTNHPLLTRLQDRCVILPHIGSATFETREAMADLALSQLIHHLDVKSS